MRRKKCMLSPRQKWRVKRGIRFRAWSCWKLRYVCISWHSILNLVFRKYSLSLISFIVGFSSISSTVHCAPRVFVGWSNFSPFLLGPCIPGPVRWKEFFPIADGDRQSPIEIKTEEAKYDASLQPLSIQYDPHSAKIISNTGHSFSVDFDDTEDRSGWSPCYFFSFFLAWGEGLGGSSGTF